MLDRCYADAMGMHPCDYGCVCDKCLHDNVELVGGNTMSRNIEYVWETLVDMGIATDEELQLVTSINGYNIDTLNDIIYVRTGYHDIEQLKMEW